MKLKIQIIAFLAFILFCGGIQPYAGEPIPSSPTISMISTKSTLITGKVNKGDRVRIYNEGKLWGDVAPNPLGRYTFATGELKAGTGIQVLAVNSQGQESSLVSRVVLDYRKMNNRNFVKSIVTTPHARSNAAEVKGIINRIAKLPTSYIIKLNNTGIEIRLINGKLTDEPEYTYLKGTVPRGWSTTGLTWDDVPGCSGSKVAPIVIKIGESSSKNHGSKNLELHEVSHTLDRYVLSNISKTNGFLDVWKKDKQKFSNLAGNKTYYNDPREYFAEAMTYYYLSGATNNQLKKMAPATHQFLLKLEKSASL